MGLWSRCCLGQWKVYGNALIYDLAQVFGKAQVFGEVQILEKAIVCDNVLIYDQSEIFGEALLFDQDQDQDQDQAFEDTQVNDQAQFYEMAVDDYIYQTDLQLFDRITEGFLLLDYDEYNSTKFCENSVDDLINWLGHLEEPANFALRDIDIQLLANNDKKRSIHQFDYVDSIPITVKMASNQSNGFSIPSFSKFDEPLQFDMDRVAAIKTESQEITARLDAIYRQENDSTLATPIKVFTDESYTGSSPLLNLDNRHKEFDRAFSNS